MTRNTLSPKAAFLGDSKRAGAHQDTVLSPEFKKALEIALLEYAMNIGGEGSDQQGLVTVGLKLEGAKGLIDVLLNLGVQSAPMAPKDSEVLDIIND